MQTAPPIIAVILRKFVRNDKTVLSFRGFAEESPQRAVLPEANIIDAGCQYLAARVKVIRYRLRLDFFLCRLHLLRLRLFRGES